MSSPNWSVDRDSLLEKKKNAAKSSSSETKDEPGKLIIVAVKLSDKPQDSDRALC